MQVAACDCLWLQVETVSWSYSTFWPPKTLLLTAANMVLIAQTPHESSSTCLHICYYFASSNMKRTILKPEWLLQFWPHSHKANKLFQLAPLTTPKIPWSKHHIDVLQIDKGFKWYVCVSTVPCLLTVVLVLPSSPPPSFPRVTVWEVGGAFRDWWRTRWGTNSPFTVEMPLWGAREVSKLLYMCVCMCSGLFTHV